MIDRPARIRFDTVARRFDTPGRGSVWALRDVSTTIERGELVCVLGPSGCGKTTLLRLAGGLDQPTAGTVHVDGTPVAGPARGVGMVSQDGSLLPWRTALANAALGLEIARIGRRERRHRAKQTLRRVGLDPTIARSYPHELSGGMRQRVALASALCVDPRVILMDEPFAAVDEPARHRLQDLLLDIWAGDRRTVLFVTHTLEEAVYLADRVVVMGFGRIIAEVAVDLSRPRDRLSDAFVQTLMQVRRHLTQGAM